MDSQPTKSPVTTGVNSHVSTFVRRTAPASNYCPSPIRPSGSSVTENRLLIHLYSPLEPDRPLLVAGVLNWVASLPGGGKSWLILLAAQQVLQEGGRVAILDFDQPPARPWGERALALGGNRFADALTEQTRCLILPGASIEPKHRAMIADWLSVAEPNLVAVDTAGAAGMPISATNIDQWLIEHLDSYRQAGLGIIVTDHLPKSPAKTTRNTRTNRFGDETCPGRHRATAGRQTLGQTLRWVYHRHQRERQTRSVPRRRRGGALSDPRNPPRRGPRCCR